jgi:hypothetical protein
VAKTTMASPLPSILDRIGLWLSDAKAGWNHVHSAAIYLRNATTVNEDIEKWLATDTDKDDGDGRLAELRLIKKHQDAIEKTIISLGMFSKGIAGFVPKAGNAVAFARHKDGSLILLFKNMASQNKYNTLRLDSKQRAGKTIGMAILPSLQFFHLLYPIKEIKYYGMIVGYGSENFLNKDKPENDLSGEAIAVIVTSAQCERFTKGEITDQELIDTSDVYLNDREMTTGIKKVKITID